MKTLFIKLAALLLITIFLQILFLIKNIRSFDQLIILEKAKKEGADIIYLGDSAVSHYSPKDLNKRAIPQMLQEILPEHSIVSVDNAAWKADIFLEVCKYIIKQKYYPKIIIIPINMRSFSPSWDKRPGYQFEEKKAILKNKLSFMFFKTIEVFDKSDKFNEITQDEFDNTEVFNGEEAAGKVKDFESHEFRHYSEENMKNTILYYYMFSLKKENRLMQFLLETAKILRENNIKPVFYITPIDYETGSRYFPGEFSERLKSNTETIKSVFSENHFEVLDFSKDLETDFFAWEKYPNEHLNEKGRKYVAEKIAEIIGLF
ncbi:MAG: hypothetical protein ABH813_02040 [Patescibacteria group bacterium]